MQKLLIIFICLFIVLNANDDVYTLNLYEKVFPTIFKKRPIKVFVDKDTKEMLKNSDKFEIINSCNKSVVLLIGKKFGKISKECKDKPIFSTHYRSYKRQKNSFGALYWRKGRLQIKFKRDVLKRFNIKLPSDLEKYIK